MALFIPIVAYSADNIVFIKKTFKFFIYKIAPLIIICIFFYPSERFGDFLAPFTFFLLFFPLVSTRWKTFFFLVLIFLIASNLGARSSLIKMIASIILSFVYYFKLFLSKKILNIVRILFLIAPIIFLSLGILGVFNIFSPKGENQIELIEKKINAKGEIIEENLATDTRTFLYIEVLTSIRESNSWLFGNSPARGNKSNSFGELDRAKRGERNGNEVGMLNYFTWLGSIGLILIFILFYQASNFAINYSNNLIIKIIGIYISFRWAYGWVEDINNFTINNIYLWIFIGICFSENFRKMTDIQMKNWVLGIFESPKRFRSFQTKQKLKLK
jgi:hypothetical protein